MTIEQIQDHIASAADDTFAPASQVSGVEVYRAGLRRRRTRRWLSATVATAVAVVVAGGAAAVVRTAEPVPVSPGGPGADKTSPTPAFRLVWPSGGPPGPVARSCTEFATMVMKSIAGALPPEITWSGPELPEVPTGSSCESGGIFWVRFTLQGESRRIGFEGGVEMSGARGCDPARHPVRCDTFPGGEVGHLNSASEYGVLFSRNDGVFFFLGNADGRLPYTLTTDQLADAATRISAEVFSRRGG